MNVYRASSGQAAPQVSARPAMCWWYTLAHEETPPAQLCVTPAALDDFAEALASSSEMASAARIAKIAREVARGGASGEGERYVWAFRRLGDALAALRANHRSDYHAYPHPGSIHEASLDRLYQRFPLPDYPLTTALLFTGSLVCPDPRLRADPRVNTLAAVAPEVIAPEEWARYTLCGFRQGVALVRVSANARWLRIGARMLEDTWATARRDAEEPTAQRGVSALTPAESLAREALLRAVPADALLHLNGATSEQTPYVREAGTVGGFSQRVNASRAQRLQPLNRAPQRRPSAHTRQKAV
ncbi:MAG TPA: hypothetical protein VE338_22365 [Ktedonobacterales bacterium]|nr:hypothetical protein [Ktedonobacterales bacterium]